MVFAFRSVLNADVSNQYAFQSRSHFPSSLQRVIDWNPNSPTEVVDIYIRSVFATRYHAEYTYKESALTYSCLGDVPTKMPTQ